MTNKTLYQLYDEHQGKVSDKWSSYLSEYERLLLPYRDQAIRLLEIGVQNGGSLEIWSQYFHHGEMFVGCDVNPDCRRLQFENPKIVVVVGDANTDETEQRILTSSLSYDLIIDDGSHQSRDIVRSFARYFKCLKPGGLYITEDLHCSYWQELEGGLFHPYSSIAFFKRLVDLLNYEHWGVEKSRRDVIRNLASTHGASLDEDVLAHLHSVEFLNSLCVIRKAEPGSNTLGPRVIGGGIESVVPGYLSLHGRCAPPPSQMTNQWSNRDLNVEEELPLRIHEIHDLHQTIGERDRQIASLTEALTARDRQLMELYSSKSWRFTRPLRVLTQQVRRLRHLVKLDRSAIERRGGMENMSHTGGGVYQRESVTGIQRRFRIAPGFRYGSARPTSRDNVQNDYAEWVRLYETMDDAGRQAVVSRVKVMARRPKMSLVMPIHGRSLQFLSETIWSVRKQLYPEWELCIAHDVSENPDVLDLLRKHADQEPSIKIVSVISRDYGELVNRALGLREGEYVGLLHPGDELAEHALYMVAEELIRHPDADVIYTDEDRIDETGRRQHHYFKPDWNPDLFLGQNYISHLGVYRASLLERIGGCRPGYGGGEDYDLNLRIIEETVPERISHIPFVLYHRRTILGSLDREDGTNGAARLALLSHFERKKLSVNDIKESCSSSHRVVYSVPSDAPLVSLIIPTKDKVELLRSCVDGILNRTNYDKIEVIIVDNQSEETETLDYFAELQQAPRVRILRYDGAYNFSAINNMAVHEASGVVVGLINNDIEVIAPDWLREMVGHALRPEIGAVGAKLYFPDGSIQHAGVVLGIQGVAGHAFRRQPREAPGYHGRMQVAQDVSAVTAACLVMRRSVYLELGGLNEVELPIAFNDVDLCIRLRERGYRILWTPYAELYHLESATRMPDDSRKRRSSFAREVAYMKARWGDVLTKDPFYSPNLSLDDHDFNLAFPPRVCRPWVEGVADSPYRWSP
ncbi:MAG: glycosyltransferase [Nitrospiraceae bacterium]